MSALFLAFVAGGRRALPWLAWLAIMIETRPSLSGHDLYRAYLQHRLHLAVSKDHIDLTLELTFFEDWSVRERRVMDADGNGRITRAEIESYLQHLAPQLSKGVSLLLAGRSVPLTVLYDPELDLLGSDQVGLAHHRLRLFFFTPTPHDLPAGAQLVIEDRLWPDSKALATIEAEGRDNCTLEPQTSGDPVFAPLRPGEARVLKVKCLKPPTFPSLTKPSRPS